MMEMLRAAGKRWLSFWFTATDPTTLGFIRIVTGSLALYVHMAYSFDLQAFFGQHGWYGLQYMERERKEFPHVVAPFWSWDENGQRTAFLPEYPHRKKAVIDWMNRLFQNHDSPDKLSAALEYLDFCQQTARPVPMRYPQVAQNGLDYLAGLTPDPRDRAVQLTVLADESQRKTAEESRVPRLIVPPTPMFVASLSTEDRAKLPAIVERFYATLPINPVDRGYVLGYLYEMDLQARDAVITFLKELSRLDQSAREKRLDYLVYWNAEERITYRRGLPIYSMWYHVTDPTAMAAIHCVVLVIFVLFTVGYQTRITSALAWFSAICYIHRTQQILFGMDTMMNILLFYLMIGNSGAALSLDRLINRYRALRHALSSKGNLDANVLKYLEAPPPSVAAGFALRLLQVHFCFIYMASGLSKLKGASWWNNNAYWDTLVNPEFTLIHYQWYEWLVRSVVSIRPAFGFMAAGAVIFTFFAEIGLPFLVWTRLRAFIVVCGFLLHAGIAVFMGLWIFSLLMMTLLLSYLPGYPIRMQFFGSPAAHRVRVRFNPQDARQARSACIAATLDWEGAITLEPDSAATALKVLVDDVEQADSAKALMTSVQGLSWLRWLTWCPGLGTMILARLR